MPGYISLKLELTHPPLPWWMSAQILDNLSILQLYWKKAAVWCSMAHFSSKHQFQRKFQCPILLTYYAQNNTRYNLDQALYMWCVVSGDLEFSVDFHLDCVLWQSRKSPLLNWRLLQQSNAVSRLPGQTPSKAATARRRPQTAPLAIRAHKRETTGLDRQAIMTIWHFVLPIP